MKTWEYLRDNPGAWDRYFVREKVYAATRAFFSNGGFHEVEVPLLLVHPPAESYVDVFATTLLDRHRKGIQAYLATSPETSLKKLLVAGIGNCFCLTKSFRNTESGSRTHNPEFSILEWYRVGVGYDAVMGDCEAYLRALCRSVRGSDLLTYQGRTFDLSKTWERISVREAFAKYAQVDLDAFFDMETARKVVAAKGYDAGEQYTWEELYNQVFLNEIEPHLGITQPTVIYGFPSVMAALSRKDPADPRYAHRFEFYIGGLELGDCYEELTDWQEQKTRFDAELAELRRLGKTTYEYDTDFIRALKTGLPECSGITVGMDRLVMLLADVTDIADVLFFPLGDLVDAS